MSKPNDEKEFKERCEEFLAQIERLEAEIEFVASDKKRVKQLKRNRANLGGRRSCHRR